MNSVLKTMNSALKTMNSALKMIDFGSPGRHCSDQEVGPLQLPPGSDSTSTPDAPGVEGRSAEAAGCGTVGWPARARDCAAAGKNIHDFGSKLVCFVFKMMMFCLTFDWACNCRDRQAKRPAR